MISILSRLYCQVLFKLISQRRNRTWYQEHTRIRPFHRNRITNPYGSDISYGVIWIRRSKVPLLFFAVPFDLQGNQRIIGKENADFEDGPSQDRLTGPMLSSACMSHLVWVAGGSSFLPARRCRPAGREAGGRRTGARSSSPLTVTQFGIVMIGHALSDNAGKSCVGLR